MGSGRPGESGQHEIDLEGLRSEQVYKEITGQDAVCNDNLLSDTDEYSGVQSLAERIRQDVSRTEEGAEFDLGATDWDEREDTEICGPPEVDDMEADAVNKDTERVFDLDSEKYDED